MKTMTFQLDAIHKIHQGQKTETRRLTSFTKYGNILHRYSPGDICMIKTSRFDKEHYGYIQILDVKYDQELFPMPWYSVKKEGFNNLHEFQQTWEKLHPDGINQRVNIISFAFLGNTLNKEN